VLSTDPDHPAGSPVKVGDTLELAPRSVLVFRET
jgi:hypothetical protein